MWKILKLIGYLLKAVFWLSLILVAAGLIALYTFERDIPDSLVQRLSTTLSSDDMLIRIDRATFNLRRGLRLHHIKAFPKRIADSALVSADEVAIEIALHPFLPLNERIRKVTIKNIVMPALPPKGPEKPKSIPVIPEMPPIPLIVENPDILGIKASRLTATVDLADKKIQVTDLAVQWPDKTFSMSAAGHVTVDFSTRLVNGNVKGQAFPENILPIFTVLHARGAIQQITCFSKLERPIDADYTFDVNIDNTDFSMLLKLDVGPCAYRGVPMEFAKGTLGIFGTNIYTTVIIGPLEAKSKAGAPISGSLIYREETEGLEIDTTTTMDTVPLFNIINVLNHGELDRIRCTIPPSISAKGEIALSSTESTHTNDLSGKIALSEGYILNFPVRDMTGDFTLQGYTAHFDNVTGRSGSGGKLAGDIAFHFPEYAATATIFTTNLKLTDVALEDISRAFNVTNERIGLVSGDIHLNGITHERTIASLSGEGHAKVRDGVLNRMKLFAGFTDYLARNIPGVSALVNQSSGSLNFTITNGVLSTENLLIEGDIFSMKGRGTYNLDTDKLDFVVRASFFKQKTIAGKITHFVTLPFTRLLLEFKVFGSIENPDWSYVNIIEKITEGFLDKTTPETPSQPTP